MRRATLPDSLVVIDGPAGGVRGLNLPTRARRLESGSHGSADLTPNTPGSDSCSFTKWHSGHQLSRFFKKKTHYVVNRQASRLLRHEHARPRLIFPREMPEDNRRSRRCGPTVAQEKRRRSVARVPELTERNLNRIPRATVRRNTNDRPGRSYQPISTKNIIYLGLYEF